MSEALDLIATWVAEGRREYVCVCSVHGIMECRRSPELRRIFNAAGLVTPDGMPLVWLARADGRRNVSRVYGPDLLAAELAASARSGHRHFFYGGREGAAQQMAAQMAGRHPSLELVGTLEPPMAPVEELADAATAEQINQARADIVWVGLSTPKQELWMARMRPLLEAPVLIGVGAAFDFHSGRVRQAPGWMQRSGLEWAFRLAMEPRRLARRYAVAVPWFLLAITLQKLRLRRFEA